MKTYRIDVSTSGQTLAPIFAQGASYQISNQPAATSTILSSTPEPSALGGRDTRRERQQQPRHAVGERHVQRWVDPTRRRRLERRHGDADHERSVVLTV